MLEAAKIESIPTHLLVGSDVYSTRLGRTESGLLVYEYEEVGSQRLLTPNHSGLVIASKSINGGLQIPTNEQIIRYGVPIQEKIEKRRTSGELAHSLYNPGQFLAAEISKRVRAEDIHVQEVLSHLEQLEYPDKDQGEYSQFSLRRQVTKGEYLNLDTQAREAVIKTGPGALETVALQAINLLKEREFQQVAEYAVLKPLSQLFTNYRFNCSEILELPEMPDLTIGLLNSLDHFLTQPNCRFAIYRLLEQTKIPDSLQEEILWKMDQIGDLSHPLSFDLTIKVAKRDPDSLWIKEQQRRREKLLEQLNNPVQQLFVDFKRLKSQAYGLVYSGDPLSPIKGKVGMEIETKFNQMGNDLTYSANPNRVSQSYTYRVEGLDQDWPLHFDGIFQELTRADNKLSHNLGYLAALSNLYKWLGSYCKELASLHIHLDRQKHPLKPEIGNLFMTKFDAHIRENNLNTWEVRCLNLPRGVGNMHPGRVEDLISLFIVASSPTYTETRFHPLRAQSPDTSLEQAIWGHICTFVDTPEGRLAALMALQDSSALRNANPLAFAISFTKDSLPAIWASVKDQFKSEEDKKMLAVLLAFAEDRLESVDVRLSMEEYEMIRKMIRNVPMLLDKVRGEYSSYQIPLAQIEYPLNLSTRQYYSEISLESLLGNSRGFIENNIRYNPLYLLEEPVQSFRTSREINLGLVSTPIFREPRARNFNSILYQDIGTRFSPEINPETISFSIRRP